MKGRLGSKARRQSVIAQQTDQKAAQDLTKDYQAIVSGEKVALWSTPPQAAVPRDTSASVLLDAVDPAVTYYTKNGTKIKVEGDDIFFNDSITTDYREAMRALELRSTTFAEGNEDEEAHAEEEITVSLKEDLPYSGMELQELKNGVYVRNFFGYPDGRLGAAESAGVKLGCKLFAMKSVPVHKLRTLQLMYQKFKVKQGDMVQFTFDVSDQSSLWNASAADDADEPLGSYTAVKSCVFRTDFDLNSIKVGTLEPGDDIEVLEARTNEQGQIRLRFDRGHDKGWVSTVAADGTTLLEPVDSNDSVNTDGSPKGPKGEYFRTLRTAALKVTFDPKGADAGTIAAGDVIEVFEQGQNKGINMLRTSAGWTIKEDENGPFFYKILEGENLIPFAVDDVLETTGPTHLWKMFGTEEAWEFVVDASLRSLTRRELNVRTTSVSEENNVVRVGMRQLKTKTANHKRSGVGLVEDLNLLKTDGPLFKVVKQEKYDCNKIMRSLMDLEYDETYMTDNGNTLERRTLQSVTLSGTVDIPIQSASGWVWMARGHIGATTGSTIHMLLCMMNLKNQSAQPCLIFFVRAKNTHPGTVKRLCSGTFKHCIRTASASVLVTQCQTAAEMYGDIEVGTYWRVISRATVRSGAGLRSSKVGVLQVGTVVKVRETQKEGGHLRVRFATKTLKGWTSISASNGNTLLEEVPENENPAGQDDDPPSGTGADGGEGCGQYVCIKRAVLREGFEDNSKKCGALKEGDVVQVTEARTNDKGLLRVKCDQGWATTTGSGGSIALELVEPAAGVPATDNTAVEEEDDDDEEDDEIDTDDPHTGQYTANKPAEVRQSYDPESAVIRKLDVGETVTVTRSREITATGQIRVRLIGGGWCSVVSKGGTTLMTKIVTPMDAYNRARAAAAAAGAENQAINETERLDIGGYLDIFLSQELQTKFGVVEGQSDDGKIMTTDATIFHCKKPEAVKMLLKKREDLLTEPEVKPKNTFQDGSINSKFSAKLIDVQTLPDERDEKNGALYVFQIADGTGNTWKVHKRFSAFHQLDKELRKTFPSNQLGKLPSKHKIPGKKDKTGKSELDMRKKAVESYLVLAMMHPQVSQSSAINVFVNEGKQGFEFTEIVEEVEKVDPVHEALLEKVEGLTEHSTVREAKEFLEKKQIEDSPMTYLIEDDHKSFPSSEALASLCNRVQEGADAQDIFLSAATGRAVARLMLWGYAWTWRSTTNAHDRVQELLYALLEKSQIPEPDGMAKVEASLETEQGRAAFCTIAQSVERSDLGSGQLLKVCKRLVGLLLTQALAQADGLTCLAVLRFSLKYFTTGPEATVRVLKDIKQHTAWTNLVFWERVLVESLAVAQAEANEAEKKSLRKQFIDAENTEANAQRDLEERVAYGQTCWVLQQMITFGVSPQSCRSWTNQMAGKLAHVFTAENVEKMNQYIDVCEQTFAITQSEEETIADEPEVEADDGACLTSETALETAVDVAAEALDSEASKLASVSEAVLEEDDNDADEEHDDFDTANDDDIEAIAARFAEQQGQPATSSPANSTLGPTPAAGKRRASISFASSAVMSTATASSDKSTASVGADAQSDDSDDSDSDSEDDNEDFLANMGKSAMKSSPRILRRPAYGDYSGGRSSASTMNRRASLAGAASGSGGRYSKFGAAARGGAESKQGSLIDAVLGNDEDS